MPYNDDDDNNNEVRVTFLLHKRLRDIAIFLPAYFVQRSHDPSTPRPPTQPQEPFAYARSCWSTSHLSSVYGRFRKKVSTYIHKHAHSDKPLSPYELGGVLSLGTHHFPQLSSSVGLDPTEAPITLEYISTFPPPNQCA